MRWRILGLVGGATAVAMAALLPMYGGERDYTREVARFRAAHEAKLRAEDGYLAVAGLFFLRDGDNAFGTDPGNDIVLPAGTAAAHSGRFHVSDRQVRVHVTDGVATLNGAPVQAGDMQPASSEPPRPADQLRVGRLTLLVHRSGDRLAIRLRDPENPVRTGFPGLRWYDVDPRYRVVGRLTRWPSARPMEIVNILGDTLSLPNPGLVEFVVGERRFEMAPVQEPDGRLWFIFTDATAGKTTYKASRFLYTDPPAGDRVILDFNRAEQPPCAYNPWTTCPLPPPQNRLPIPIEAGERLYEK